jgi:hypothetical protein
MLLHENAGQDCETARRLLTELAATNPVSRGLPLPDGGGLPTATVERLLGFTPSWMEAYGTTGFELVRVGRRARAAARPSGRS